MSSQDELDLLTGETSSRVADSHKFALVVGINDSSVSPLGKLKHAEDDAHEIYHILRQEACNFQFQDSVLTADKAKSGDVRGALVRLIEGKTDQDFLLFYFIGHAQPVRTKKGDSDIYFVTHDFSRNDLRVDPHAHLSMSWLRETLYEMDNIGKILIILDCCYAGNMIETRSHPAHIRIDVNVDIHKLVEECLTNQGIKYQNGRLRVILTATRYNEAAQERDSHTLLSYLMLPALQGKIADARDYDGNINILSLYMYLQSQMPEEQLPNLSGDFPRSCILASYPEQSRQNQDNELKSELALIIREELKIVTDPDYFRKHAVPQHIHPFDCTLCTEASVADLNLERVSSFVAKERVRVQKDFLPGLSDQEQLVRLGFFREGLPTYGALLCLGSKAPDWLSGASLRCFHWRGTDRTNGWKDDKEYRDGLLEQFEAGRRFLGDCLHSSRVIDKDGSMEQLDTPIRVLEEVLANALIHREYAYPDSFKHRTESVQVHVFDDRIEIASPGPPPYPMRLELFGIEDEPHLRNPEIARIFYLNGYVEKAGSGIVRIQQLMQDADLLPPHFELSGTQTLRVTLYRPQQTSTSLSRRDLSSQAPFDESSSPNSQQSQEKQVLRDLQPQKGTQGADQPPIDISPLQKPARAGGVRGIFSLFRRDIVCPRCLRSVRIPTNVEKVLICNECKFAIPFAYVRDFKRTSSVFVQLFGLPGAGKTTFLDMLRLQLYELHQIWDGFYAQPITQLDLDHQAILLTERTRGIMPGSTPKRGRNQNEVYIMSLVNMVRWGSHFLVLMDHSGEQFANLIVDVEEIPFLQHAPVTILLFSLSDLLHGGKKVNDLVTSYITSLEAYGANFKRTRRQLVVVFSKADLISNLAPELRDYLNTDVIYMALSNRQQGSKLGGAEMDTYIKWMEYISGVTRQWIRENVPSGAAMLNMLDDKGIETRFTVMSATGHSFTGGGNMSTPLPRRVLDPFFWVLEFYRENGR